MTNRYLPLLVFFGIFVISPLFADSLLPPRSYKEVLPSGKFIFVMLVPKDAWNYDQSIRNSEVHPDYTRSGMYRNDGSTEPIWTVEWYSHGVDLAQDGVHLIRPGPWAWLRENTPALDVEAVSFFANGQLLRTYQVGELVNNPGSFQQTVSHYWWQREGRLTGEYEYTIMTLDGNRFVFDVRTGEIVFESRMGWLSRWGWQLIFYASSVCIFIWLIWFWFRRRRTNV